MSVRDIVMSGAGAEVPGDNWGQLYLRHYSRDAAWYSPSGQADDFTIVAVGSVISSMSSGIIYSKDGTTWKKGPITNYTHLNAITRTNNLFVAVGNKGVILTSPDGIAWVYRASNTPNNLNCVNWNGTILTVGGDYGVILTSQDGIVWNKVETQSEVNFKDIAWSQSTSTHAIIGTTFNEVYEDFEFRLLLTTNSFSTWIFNNVFPSTQADNASITFANNKFTVAGDGFVSNSSNSGGTGTWNATFISGLYLSDLFWTGTSYTASGYNGNIYGSANGVNWSVLYDGVAADNGPLEFIMAGNEALGVPTICGARYILKSTNGVSSWTKIYSGTNYRLNGIAWNGSIFVAVGNGSTLIGSPILLSTDGFNWTPISPIYKLNSVIWTGSMFVAVGDSALVLTSTDGTTWTKRNIPGVQTYNLNAAVWSGTNLVAVGSSGVVLNSSDMINWTVQTVRSNTVFTDIAWSGNYYVVIGRSNSSIYRSTDGLTWESVNLIPSLPAALTDSYRAIIWNGEKFVVIGNGAGTVFVQTSLTGSGWVRSGVSGIGVTTLEDICWTGYSYVIVGQYGLVITSQNAVNWTLKTSTPTPLTSRLEDNLYGVIFANNKIVAVGGFGSGSGSGGNNQIVLSPKPQTPYPII